MPRLQDLKVKYLDIEPTNSSDSGFNITGDAVIGSNLAVTGNTTITGDLTVKGTTTTIESVTTVYNDPILQIGGTTDPTDVDDKDRGISFLYYKDSVGVQTGFIGYDHSADGFIFKTDATISGEEVSGTNSNITCGILTASSIVGDVTGVATQVTVTDSTADTAFPVVFNNESNSLLDDTGSFTYNPSSGVVTATTFSGALSGNADTATKIASITNSDIVQLTATQTLTNKSLTSPAITGDLTIYDDTNDADVSLSMGTSATEALVITVLNGGANKTAESITFNTKTESVTADHGKFTFSVDEVSILDIDDDGIVLKNSGTIGCVADNDLITLASAVVTIAGEISVTTLDIGGVDVTSTAAELNILDASAGNIAVASDVETSSGDFTSNNYKISHTLTLAAELADDAVHADITITSDKVLATSVVIANCSLDVHINIHTVVAGSFKVRITNKSGGALADDSTMIINYRII